MGESKVKQFLFGSGALFCLLLYIAVTGLAGAHEVDSGSCDELHQQEEQRVHSDRANRKPLEASLKKVMTAKYPRRTDIPEAFLIVMLALIGVVVIARRDVSGKEQGTFPEKGLKTER